MRSSRLDDIELILLPGLDGTGGLFAPLLSVLPKSCRAGVISYPADRALSYDDLLKVLSEQIPHGRRVVLVAESFSGPLALRYACEHGGEVEAVVLCASFVRSPFPRWLATLVRPSFFRLPAPTLAIRLLLVGWRTPECLVRTVRSVIKRVRPEVLAQRVREIARLDCTAALAACPAPIFYLRAEHDLIVRADALRLIRATHPGVVVRTVPGSHLLLQAQPTTAWEHIAGSLNTNT